MTSKDIEDSYPHWKEALFGNHNAVANIRCAVHYVFWHSVYALMAIVGGILVAGLTVIETAAQYTGPIQRPIDAAVDQAIDGIIYVLDHEITEAVARILMLIIGAAMVASLAYILINKPTAVALTIGYIIIILVLSFAAVYAWEKIKDPASEAASTTATKARSAGEKAVETPGVRRVYGKCPVSMDQAPKWFDKIFERDEER